MKRGCDVHARKNTREKGTVKRSSERWLAPSSSLLAGLVDSRALHTGRKTQLSLLKVLTVSDFCAIISSSPMSMRWSQGQDRDFPYYSPVYPNGAQFSGYLIG